MKTSWLSKFTVQGVTWVQVSVESKIKAMQNDRGDIPGWVLVTVMSAGLVVAVWSVADGQLRTVLTSALRSVSQP